MSAKGSLTGAGVIARRLAEAGCTHAFGIPGGEVLALMDALKQEGIRFSLCKHENAGGFMAEGVHHATGAPAVKDQLRQNTEEAVAAGVYGVPSFVIEDHLFWGDDMFEMLCAWIKDPTLLNNPEARRISDLPPAAERKR